MFLLSTGAYAQVHIGDGLFIQEGTSFVIKNQDVIIATDEIKGDGNLSIHNDEEQHITVSRNLKTKTNIQITTKDVVLKGSYAQNFAKHHLPPLSEEIIVLVEKEKIKKDLPVRYINTEGLVFDKSHEDKEECTVSSLPIDVAGGVIISEVLRMQLADIQLDYIIPIYSIILNDERFSDNAELYEFECLTAILKPPIA